MEYKIQKIVFPTENKYQQCKDLFYHGNCGYLDRKSEELCLGKGQNVDFATYLNGCSYRKWRTYTKAGNVILYLDLEGTFELCVVGYSKKALEIERTEYVIQEYCLKDRQTIRFEFPENNDQILGFEISSKETCKFFGGYYAVMVDESELNEVNLCIATTTCRKEKFIKRNVKVLKQSILESDEPMKENFFVHVVDNGQTLTNEDINGYHVYLHPNHNVGGAGGFARGMIESLNQKPKATHVLLMDDDVLILPESIKRTYHLLRLRKEEYKDRFISGAMLRFEEPNIQHEDIGTIMKNGYCRPLKPNYNQAILMCNLENESEFVYRNNEYAAWWYCCIPTKIIEKNGLPLPIFIRWDDVEYSLRCKAKFITMNGICVWHMGFATKYNAAMDRYQECRNILIDKACSDILQDVDGYDKVRKEFRVEMLRFNYDVAELVLRAFEDYLRGPDFLKKNNGEKILKRNIELNEKFVPLNEIGRGDLEDVFSCFADPERKFVDKWLYRLTYNGQRLWPFGLYKKENAYIAFDHSYQPQKMAMHDEVIAVNPFEKTGVVRKLDKKRFRELMERYKRAEYYCKKHQKRIEKAYKEERPYMTSETFWRKYLEI